MVKRYTFKRIQIDFPHIRCWYCQGRPLGVLTDLEVGDECRTCEKCAEKYLKIRRHKNRIGKSIQNEKDAKIEPNSRIKIQTIGDLSGGYDEI